VSAAGGLALWGWLASLWAVLVSFRAQRWLNRWSEVSRELARALDRIAGLEEALRAAQEDRQPHARFSRHTRDEGGRL
jgi:hypothetical protein